jgi:hypothetical protein
MLKEDTKNYAKKFLDYILDVSLKTYEKLLKRFLVWRKLK